MILPVEFRGDKTESRRCESWRDSVEDGEHAYFQLQGGWIHDCVSVLPLFRQCLPGLEETYLLPGKCRILNGFSFFFPSSILDS
jgi:hypothetical protein